MSDSSAHLPAPDRQLDVCGLRCPMPILKTKKALAEMASGEVLEILVTDPAAREDFAAFARQTGHAFMHADDAADHWVIYLRRK